MLAVMLGRYLLTAPTAMTAFGERAVPRFQERTERRNVAFDPKSGRSIDELSS